MVHVLSRPPSIESVLGRSRQNAVNRRRERLRGGRSMRVVTCRARASQGLSSERTPCVRGAGIGKPGELTHAEHPPEVAWRAVATLFHVVAPAFDRFGGPDPSTRVWYRVKGPCVRIALLQSEIVLTNTFVHIGPAAPLSRRGPRRSSTSLAFKRVNFSWTSWTFSKNVRRPAGPQ